MTVDGSDLEFSTYLGGRDVDEGLAIAVFGGQAVVTGYTASMNFPKHEAYQGQLKGDGDGFVTRVAADGGSFVYSTFLGGTGVDRLHDVVVDTRGIAHVTGSTDSANFPTNDPLQSRLNGPMDAVLASLSPGGQDLLFGSYFGGSRGDASYGLAADWRGLTFAGYTESADLLTSGGLQDEYAGQGDAFLARMRRDVAPTPTPLPASCAIHPDPGPRSCPDGFAYPGLNGGFELPNSNVSEIDDWYNPFSAWRAVAPAPVQSGAYSLSLNPAGNMLVPNGTIAHQIDLSRPGAPQQAVLSVPFLWDGGGSVKLTVSLGGQPAQTLVDTASTPVPVYVWQNSTTIVDRGVLTGVQPVTLRWQIAAGASAYIDNVDVVFCCAGGTLEPSATSTATIHPTWTPSDTAVPPTEPPTAAPTDKPEPPMIYLPRLSKP